MAAKIGRIRSQINDKAVCELASRLNHGKSCNIEYPSKIVGSGSLMGCANYHARIHFDGEPQSWLIRVPRVSCSVAGLQAPLVEYLIRSEYSTLKFLETTAVPAPRAFSFGIPSQGTDHGIGVCFLLTEELPGEPWYGEGDSAKIWKGLADIFEELEKHPFAKAGSLSVESPNDCPSVSATASDRFVCIEPFGPFQTSEAYYTAWTEQYLDLIADGQLYSQFPVEAYLVYRFLQDNVAELSDPEDEFFLKHVDDKGDHLLVDEDLNITGIIDGHVSLSENDVALSKALSERGSRLSRYTGDEKVRRFFWGLGLESEWKSALPLANAILHVFGFDGGWAKWKETALKQFEADQRLQDIIKDITATT